MTNIEDKIRRFVDNPENQTAALALLKVGVEKGEKPEQVVRVMIASALFDFHGIPSNPTE